MADLAGVDILSLIEKDTSLKRTAGTKGGEWAGPCPFCGGTDRLRVWPNHPEGRGQWWCRQCGKQGDAIDYVRARDNVGYREACEALGVDPNGGQGTRMAQKKAHVARRERIKPTLSPAPEADGPTYDLGEALVAVEMCGRILWADPGARALEYLVGRGIQEDTAKTWGLGFNPEARKIGGLWIERGLVIPGWVGYIPWYLKIRKGSGDPKYVQVKGSKPALYGLDMLVGRPVVIICEGELDAILLWQEAGDLVDVVALGSKGAQPAIPFLGRLIGASRWLVCLDNDAEAEAAKWGEWSARVRRIRPLQGNDVTDFHEGGGDLRRWVTYHLERLRVPMEEAGGAKRYSARYIPRGIDG